MNTFTRTIIVWLALALGAAPALAQVTPNRPKPPKPPKASQGQARFEETERQTLHVPNVTELELSNISGDIVISPGGGRDATVEVVKHGYGDTREEAREQLSFLNVRLAVSERGRGAVRARYYREDNRRHNFRSSADYTVTAPAGTIIHVNTVSGSIRASKMKGDLSLQSVSGNVTLESPERVSAAKSVSGEVHVSGGTLEGPLEVSSVSGTVRLESLKARRIEANSVSGNVLLKNVACERASVQTISGDVDYSGAIMRGGRYELQAHSGNIRLAVSGNVGFEIEANSFSGDIRSALPITNEAAASEEGLPGKSGMGIPRRAPFRGTYGDGSATVELSTFSGDIIITK